MCRASTWRASSQTSGALARVGGPAEPLGLHPRVHLGRRDTTEAPKGVSSSSRRVRSIPTGRCYPVLVAHAFPLMLATRLASTIHSGGFCSERSAVSRRERTGGRWFGFGFDRVSRDAAGTASLERESDELLRRQNRYLESLLEISPTAIVTLDLDRMVTSWNLAAEELFGHTRWEAIGRDLEDSRRGSGRPPAEAVGVLRPARSGASASGRSPGGRGRTARS